MANGIKYTLTFGRDIPSGGEVTGEDLEWFINIVLTHYFPCFSLTEFIGVWEGTREKCFSVDVFIESPTVRERETTRVKLQLVAKIYKKEFGQESVMYTETAVDKCAFL